MPLHKASSTGQSYNKLFQRPLNLVVAYTFNKQGIGKDGNLPWVIQEDMIHFKEITLPKSSFNFSIVIMGRKTWDSIPDKFKPLSNRYNIVLSNDKEYKKLQSQKYANANANANANDTTTSNWKTSVKFTTWESFFNEEYLDVEFVFRNKVNNQQMQAMQQSQLNQGMRIPYTFESATFSYYVIGGESIYQKAIDSNLNLNIYATEIYTQSHNIIECDTFFPKIDKLIIHNVSSFYKSKQLLNDYSIWYRFITFIRIINPALIFNDIISFTTSETDYLKLMQNILENGQSNDDRTGVGTLSIFGSMLKYNLQDTFPISTTKRVFFRAIFEELMLYLSGKTDNTILQEKGIHVWDGNTSREFLDKRGLTDYVAGDMGQTYGFNMRHFGGIYKGCKMEYTNDGNSNSNDNGDFNGNVGNGNDGNVNGNGNYDSNSYGYDQLANVINLIKTDPFSRRIIIDLWDASTVHKAALPSCLCKYQFNVNVAKKELNLAIYLRSSDYFLANNWNTCTGALLVHLLCNLEDINLTPGELTVFIADAHIYKSHIEQVKLNLERKPYPYPKLLVCCNANNNANNNANSKKKKNILDFKFEDLELIGYKAHSAIKAEMAV